jgi:eukaryotic-like serine/threonine-protein kinase
VNNRLTISTSVYSTGTSRRRELADILERYLADLERGVAQDQESLLGAHPELADELRPYLDNIRMLHDATHEIRSTRTPAKEAESPPPESGARQIGEYRIVREIGRGGMGIVYEAHQQSLNRQVALKILPFAAVLDQRQIARFRNEAQAAAQLHHPHIVPVFAVGQEQGVYYYAMQLIDGQSLEQVIAQLRNEAEAIGQRSTKVDVGVHGSTKTMQPERGRVVSSQPSLQKSDFYHTAARLGKEAALALQHAHEYGIVHRDVKPSNLLIDERAQLWVTDFGLARMQSDSGVTLTGDVVGTLRYMSPEQAAGRTDLVDGRTDVYSLGVTLYELLTQRPAHDGEDRQTLMRQVIGDEPIQPRKLNPAIPVDLETIVLAAMAKSREERYSSAQALADDLDRFLTGKPTLARRPTVIDRAAKWARRHRPLVAVGVCAMILVSTVSAVGLALLVREQARTSAALVESEKNFQRAEKHFKQAREVVDQFGMRVADRLLEIPGAEALRRDVLLDALKYYRQFLAHAGNDSQLRQEIAVAHFKTADIAAKLGLSADALTEYQTAEEQLTDLTSAKPVTDDAQTQLATVHNNLGLLLAARGDMSTARTHYQAAIRIQQRLVDEHKTDPAFAGQLAESEGNLGMLLDQIGDSPQAEKSLRSAVEVRRRAADSTVDQPQPARDLAIACNNLSYVLRNRDVAGAEKTAQEAIGILERLVHENPTRIQFQDDLALCYNNLAALESRQERWGTAIESHQKAIALEDRLVRKAPGVVRYRSDLATSLNNLGVAFCRAEKSDEGDAPFGRARDLLSTLADDYADEPAYRSSLAALLNNQALALAGAGRQNDALAIYPQAIEKQREAFQQRPELASMQEVLSKLYYNYGQSLGAVGRWSDALDAAVARREVWRKNGERLIGVAAEMAQMAEDSQGEASRSLTDSLRQKVNNEAIDTLYQARDCGWPQGIDLAADKRFAKLHTNERFAALVAELKSKPDATPKTAQAGHTTSSSTTN